MTSFLAFELMEKQRSTLVQAEVWSGSPSTNVVGNNLADRYKSVKVPANIKAPMMDSIVLEID